MQFYITGNKLTQSTSAAVYLNAILFCKSWQTVIRDMQNTIFTI